MAWRARPPNLLGELLIFIQLGLLLAAPCDTLNRLRVHQWTVPGGHESPDVEGRTIAPGATQAHP